MQLVLFVSASCKYKDMSLPCVIHHCSHSWHRWDAPVQKNEEVFARYNRHFMIFLQCIRAKQLASREAENSSYLYITQLTVN